MTDVETTETAGQRIERVARELGLTVEAVFVPFSRSRNAAEKSPSLNWRVSLKIEPKAGGTRRTVLETDYSAGCGHCPAYKGSVKAFGAPNSLMRDGAIRAECETGRAVRVFDSANSPTGYAVRTLEGGKPLMPESADVIASLVLDSDALDCAAFEEWAGNLGYDTDSRSAEKTYRACLEIALALRNGIGEAGLAKLREACQDY